MEAFLFMKGIKAALCFHSALHSAPMLFFAWPLLPCAREEFDKVTPGPCYLFLSLHLPSLSQILIVCLAGLLLLLISSVRSHLWAALTLSPPALALSFILLLKWPANWQVWFNFLQSLDPCTGQGYRLVPWRCKEWSGGKFLQQENWPPCPATSWSPLNLNLQGGLSCTIHF